MALVVADALWDSDGAQFIGVASRAFVSHGKYVGSTPSTVQLKVGDHKIAVKKKGYTTWERTIMLSPGGNIVVDATLEKEAPPPPAVPIGGPPTLPTKPLRPAPAR